MAQKWTKEEDAVLDRIWADDETNKIVRAAKALGRPWQAVKSHVGERRRTAGMAYSEAKRCGGGPVRTVTDDRIRELVAAYVQHGARLGAELLGCTPREIYYAVEQATKRGIPIGRPKVKCGAYRRWTPDDEAAIDRIMGDPEARKIERIAEAINRSTSAVRNYVEKRKSHPKTQVPFGPPPRSVDLYEYFCRALPRRNRAA